MNILKTLVSTTQSVKSYNTAAPIELEILFQCIKDGKIFNSCNLKHQVSKIRELKISGGDEEQIKREKLKLPSVRVGVYQPNNMRKTQPGILTGLISFDLDHVGGILEIERVKSILVNEKDLTPIAAFKSPSGEGLKLIYITNIPRINSRVGELEFKRGWEKIATAINNILERNSIDITVDPAPKHPSSAFFASYDPEIWFCTNPTLIEIPPSESSSSVSQFTHHTQANPNKNTLPKEKKDKQNTNRTVSKHPIENFGNLLNLNQVKTSKALTLIQAYLNTPIGVGERYKKFFKTSLGLARLGIPIGELVGILKMLDYDQSRDIDGVLESINKYLPKGPTNEKGDYLLHINQMKCGTQQIEVSRWIREAGEKIMESINKYSVTQLTSPTGTGKTTFCLQDIPKVWQGRIFMAVPLVSLRDQIGSVLLKGDYSFQILGDGDVLNAKSKIVVASFEKMSSVLHHLKEKDLLIIDECHLVASSFRAASTSKLLAHMTQSKHKTLLISATQTDLTQTLSKIYPSFNSIKLFVKNKKSFDLKVWKTPDVHQSVMIRCEELLKENRSQKILVFRDDKDALHNYQKYLNERGISSTILSSDEKDTQNFKNVINGAPIQENVLLATSTVSVGVDLKGVDKILISGKIEASSVVQIGDRARNGQQVEMFISNNSKTQKNFFRFHDTFWDTYLNKVHAWLNAERLRIDLLFEDPSFWDVQNYLGALNQSFSVSIAPNTPTPLHKILRADKKLKLTINEQGILSNIYHLELRNEANLDYYMFKLETLYGISVKVETEKPASNKNNNIEKSKLDVWGELNKVVSQKGELDIEEIEFYVKGLGLSEKQSIEILEEIFRRLDFLRENRLKIREYIFVKDFNQIQYLTSIKKNPDFHPVEKAVAKVLQEENIQILFVDDMRKIVENIDLKDTRATHHQTSLLELGAEGLAKFFRRFLEGKNSRRLNPYTKRQSRCLVLSDQKILWDGLKERVYYGDNQLAIG